jgi:hypothetical protein
MQRMRTIAVVVLAVLAACKDQKSAATGGGSGSASTGTGSTSGSSTPDPSTPDAVAPGSGSARPGGPETGVPECEAYRTAVEKLMACDKVEKSARDATKAAFEKAAAQWATPEGKTGAAATCLAAIEGMKQSFASIGCEL